MIPDEIEGVLIILAIIGAVIVVGLWICDRIGQRREPEPETFGDEGGMPAPADYSDDVTDEHHKRIAEIVDQAQFSNAEVVSGPAWVKFRRYSKRAG